jgi:hypothetical protein
VVVVRVGEGRVGYGWEGVEVVGVVDCGVVEVFAGVVDF